MGLITRSSAAKKTAATCPAKTKSSHHRPNNVATTGSGSEYSAVTRRSTRKLTKAAAEAAESSKVFLVATQRTRSSSSAKSSRKGCVIKRFDAEMLRGDPKQIDVQPRQGEQVKKVLAAPNDDHDVTLVGPSIVGKSGSYQIFKICALAPKQPAPTRQSNAFKQTKSVGSGIKLGLSLECRGWMSEKLRASFERGPTSYTIVKDVMPGSIAHHAGALKDDILVWSQEPEPVSFRELMNPGWQLIDKTQLKEKNPSQQLNASGFFSFYVARPFSDEPQVTLELPPATRLSTTDIFLSDSIVTRAKRFNLLTAREKVQLLKDARDDAKNCFERDRDIVMASLPEVVKKSFYEVKFAAWGTMYLPVLILSPFSLSGTSSAGRLWFDTYEKVSFFPVRVFAHLIVISFLFLFSLQLRKADRLSTMRHLVLWYGEADPNSQFSMVPQRNILSVDDAIERNCFGLPATIQDKMSENKKLTDNEKSRVRAQKEMEEDLCKKPDERILGRIPVYAEPHETIRESVLVEWLATKIGCGAGRMIESSKKRKMGDSEKSDRVSIPSLMTHTEASLAATNHGLSMRIELTLDEEALPISEAEYHNLQSMLTVFCRVALLDKLSLTYEQLDKKARIGFVFPVRLSPASFFFSLLQFLFYQADRWEKIRCNHPPYRFDSSLPSSTPSSVCESPRNSFRILALLCQCCEFLFAVKSY